MARRESTYYIDKDEEFEALDREDQIIVLMEVFGDTREKAIAVLDSEYIEDKLDKDYHGSS